MKGWFLKLRKVLLVPSLTAIVILLGTYLSDADLSQANSPIRLVNKTTGFEVVNVKTSGRSVRMTLKNNYDKTITAYAISPGGYHTLYELADADAIAPGSTREEVLNLARGRADNEVTILSVLFEDETGDGESTFVKEIQDLRLGRRVQYRRIRPVLDSLLAASDEEFPAKLREAATLVDGLSSESERESSHFFVAGLRNATASMLQELSNIERASRESGTYEGKDRVTKIRDRSISK